MKLLRVRLDGFGAFNKGLDVTLAPDRLNLIVGRNEAGKSTLMNAVFGVLFGFRDLNLVRKYEPWDDHDAYAGELDLETEDGRTFRIRRDFESNTAQIDIVTGDHTETVFSGRADPRSNRDQDLTYYEKLGGLLGFKDESVFRSTVFFGQQSLQTAVSDQIRRLVSGSTSVDYKGALHDLHGRFSELTARNPWNAKSRGNKRLIEQTETDLGNDRTRLDAGRNALSRSLELEVEIGDIEIRLEEADRIATEHRVKLDAAERLLALLGRRDDANRRYGDALSRRDNYNRYADRDLEIEDQIGRRYGHFRQVPHDFSDQVRAFATDQEEMRREVDQLTQQREALEHLKPRANIRNGLILGGSLAGSAALLGTLTPVGPVVAVGIGAASALLGYVLGCKLGTGFKEEKARCQERIRHLQASIKARRKRSEEILAAAGSSLLGRDPEEVMEEFRGFQELREERKRLVAAMKALGDRDQVERAFREATQERSAIEVTLQELLEQDPSLAPADDPATVGGEIQRLRDLANEHQEHTLRDRERLEVARVELASLSASIDCNLAELEEGVRDKEQRLESYDLERDALKVAIDTLDQCIKDFQEGDLLRLSEEMSGIFARITGEKYTRIHLGAGMEPVISRGDAVPISPDNLSQGAQDQLYFAMRVAMARHLSRNIWLPLFLDDPFVNFDAERLQVTKEVLKNLGGHQVIMVTCNRDYVPWTDSVIDLDEARDAA